MRKKREPIVGRNCLNCNEEFFIWPSRLKIGKGRFCSISCGKQGENNHRWGGGIRRSNGYLDTYFKNHPNKNSKNYVPQHRFVMECLLGRLLKPNEVVHHKNGIRNDNRIENLELLKSQSEHMKKHFDKTNRRWASIPEVEGSSHA